MLQLTKSDITRFIEDKSELIQFEYPGKKVTFGSGSSKDALERAIKTIERELYKNNTTFILAYCWPDGSLYYYIKASKEILSAILANLLSKEIKSISKTKRRKK